MKSLTAFVLDGLRRRPELLAAVQATGDATSGELEKMNSLEIASILLASFDPFDRGGVVAATDLVTRCVEDAGEMDARNYQLVSGSPEAFAMHTVIAGLYDRMDEEDASKSAATIQGLFLDAYPSIGAAYAQIRPAAEAAYDRPRG